ACAGQTPLLPGRGRKVRSVADAGGLRRGGEGPARPGGGRHGQGNGWCCGVARARMKYQSRFGSDRTRTEAPIFCFDAFSSREPVSTSPENAIKRGKAVQANRSLRACKSLERTNLLSAQIS